MNYRYNIVLILRSWSGNRKDPQTTKHLRHLFPSFLTAHKEEGN